MKPKQIITLMCVLLIVALSAQTLAEVRVLTDRDGSYRMVRVTQGARGQNVWTPARRSNPVTTLNVYGDSYGDLRPIIRESSLTPYHPWVVWSKVGENGYGLAWSRWENDGWAPISWVAPSEGVGDSLDADMQFDGNGRPYVTWWRQGKDGGRVLLSLFIGETAWMIPFPVSEDGVDSRYPRFESVSEHSVAIRYETAAGTVEQVISFTFPVTITEDINPLDYVQTESTSLVEE
jgi:hypothetical protein